MVAMISVFRCKLYYVVFRCCNSKPGGGGGDDAFGFSSVFTVTSQVQCDTVMLCNYQFAPVNLRTEGDCIHTH